jgi:membrane protein required for colicin V production
MTGSTLDLIFTVIVIIIVIKASLRGFIGELMSMASVILGIVAAILFRKSGAAFIREQFMSGMNLLPEILACISIFLIVWIIFRVVEFTLKNIIDLIHLGAIDRFLGIVFGLLEGLGVLCLALFLLVTIQPILEPHTDFIAPMLEKSLFARYLLPLVKEIQSIGASPEGINNV